MTGTEWLRLFSSWRILFYSKVNLPPTQLLPAAVHAGNHGRELLCKLQKAFEEGWGGRGETKALVSSQLQPVMMDWNIAHAERLSIESDTQTNPLKPTLHWGPFSLWKIRARHQRSPRGSGFIVGCCKSLKKKKKKRLARPLHVCADGRSISQAKLHKRWPPWELARHPSPSSRQYDR